MGFYTCPNTGVNIYDKESYVLLKEAAHIAYSILLEACNFCKEGVTTLDLNKFIEDLIIQNKCKPAFLGYENFPYASCLSVNEHIVHGLPTSRPLQEGDVISIDLGVVYKNHYADNANTIIIGQSNSEHTRLITIAEQAFNAGFKTISTPNITTGDIGFNIHKEIMSVVKEGTLAIRGGNIFNIFPRFEGHGIGNDLHEAPNISNTGYPGKGVALREGMCFCIEPVIMYSTSKVVIYTDKNYNILQFVTEDKRPSSHYERQIFITNNGPEIITC